mgnify:CR=1 FL=1
MDNKRHSSDAVSYVRPHFDQHIDVVHPRLFGAFVEQMGRSVYTGIYEADHPTADARGFRGDVKELVRGLGVTTLRYPGGNFVSGYRWEDGVGPVEERPVRLDLAWHSTEPNTVGLHEFASWAEESDAQMMLAVNLGTRGLEEALELLEYANHRGSSELADRRRRNGREDPFDVRMWCLGNEVDGPWQLGSLSAEEYGRLASRVARAFRRFDPTLELVACGSSASFLPTFGDWEREVLMQAYDDVDFISCHAYYEEIDGDTAAFLSSSDHMQRVISDVSATIEHVRSVKKSDRRVRISFDEWNVWYQADQARPGAVPTSNDDWPIAPPILEDQYTAADAVVVGSLLITLLNNVDVVHAACLAQLVNVIGPIVTVPGGPAFRQTSYFPFAETASRARGSVVKTLVSSPTHAAGDRGDVASIVAATTFDPVDGTATVFLANRSATDAVSVDVDVTQLGVCAVDAARLLHDPDFHAKNTAAEPERVGLMDLDVAVEAGHVRAELPPCSWAVIALSSGRAEFSAG